MLDLFRFEASLYPGRDSYHKRILQSFGKMRKVLKNFELSFAEGDEELAKTVSDIEKALTKTESAFKPLAALLISGRPYASVQDTYVPYRTSITDLENKTVQLKENILQKVENVSSEAFRVQEFLFKLIPVVSIVVIFIGTLIGFLSSSV